MGIIVATGGRLFQVERCLSALESEVANLPGVEVIVGDAAGACPAPASTLVHVAPNRGGTVAEVLRAVGAQGSTRDNLWMRRKAVLSCPQLLASVREKIKL